LNVQNLPGFTFSKSQQRHPARPCLCRRTPFPDGSLFRAKGPPFRVSGSPSLLSGPGHWELLWLPVAVRIRIFHPSPEASTFSMMPVLHPGPFSWQVDTLTEEAPTDRQSHTVSATISGLVVTPAGSLGFGRRTTRSPRPTNR